MEEGGKVLLVLVNKTVVFVCEKGQIRCKLFGGKLTLLFFIHILLVCQFLGILIKT